MRFEAKILKDGKKVFEAKGDKQVGKVLEELDKAVLKEIGKGK